MAVCVHRASLGAGPFQLLAFRLLRVRLFALRWRVFAGWWPRTWPQPPQGRRTHGQAIGYPARIFAKCHGENAPSVMVRLTVNLRYGKICAKFACKSRDKENK